MIKLIQSITLSQIVWSVVVLIPVTFLFWYWIRKKNRDMKKRELEEKKKELDWLLESEEIPEDYYLKY